MRDRSHIRLARGALAGLLTAWVALGVAQLLAGIVAPQASPIAAVGSLAIDHTPPAVKNFAIATFGSHDKSALVIGILVVLAVLAAGLGIAGLRRLGYGFAGLAGFALVGLLAALTRPGASAADVLPTVAGAAAGAGALSWLVRAARGAGGTVQPAAAGPGTAGPAAQQLPGRRAFLVAAPVALAVGGIGAAAGRSLAERSSVSAAVARTRLPRAAHPVPPLPAGTSLDVKGISPFVTPNGQFYRVDTALILPQVPPQSWQLRIHGMVEREITLDFAQLLRRPLTEDWITLCCVSNPVAGPYIGNAKWLGASLASLLRTARVRAGADQLLCTSADGFTSGTPIATVLDGRDALLAVGMNGSPLPVAHGFPARMVVPGLYGYVSATKWVTDIKVTTYAAEVAYWAQRGWSPQAPVKTECRIDVPGGQVRPGRTAVAGVAWAQHKGIDAVHVRVDHGPWQQARLAAVPGIDSWRQWAWDWEAPPGAHTIEARATDATGYTQTARQESPEPNGASGYPAITVQVS